MVTECVPVCAPVCAAATSKLAGTRKPVPSSAAAEVTAGVVTMMTAEATARIVTMMAAEVTARIVTAAVATEVPAAVATTVTAAMAATTTAAAALAPRSASYWRQRQRNTHRQYRNELWFHGALPGRFQLGIRFPTVGLHRELVRSGRSLAGRQRSRRSIDPRRRNARLPAMRAAETAPMQRSEVAGKSRTRPETSRRAGS
jgi:hypothetical protein